MAAVDDRDPEVFTVVRHGFDRGQVRQRLDELTAALDRTASERDEATAQAAELRGELEIARREIIALTERLDTQSDEQSGARMVAVAKSQAAEVTARAKAAAEHTWAATEKASADLRDHYQALLRSLDEQHGELTRTHRTLMASAKAQAEKMTTEAERRQEAIDKAAERDRIRIDREFSETMTTKRDTLRQELTKAKTDMEREVTTRLRAADEEANRRVTAVTAQVQKLSSVREQLSTRLRETKELLDLSTSLMEPVEGESEAEDLAKTAGPATTTAATAAATTAVTEKPKRPVPPQRQPAKR
jgi:chromosome segregation ATPase